MSTKSCSSKLLYCCCWSLIEMMNTSVWRIQVWRGNKSTGISWCKPSHKQFSSSFRAKVFSRCRSLFDFACCKWIMQWILKIILFLKLYFWKIWKFKENILVIVFWSFTVSFLVIRLLIRNFLSPPSQYFTYFFFFWRWNNWQTRDWFQRQAIFSLRRFNHLFCWQLVVLKGKSRWKMHYSLKAPEQHFYPTQITMRDADKV